MKKESIQSEIDVILSEILTLTKSADPIYEKRRECDRQASEIWEKIHILEAKKLRLEYALAQASKIRKKQISFKVHTIGTDSKHLLRKWLGVTLEFESLDDIKTFNTFITNERKTPINYKLTLTKLN